MTNQVPSQETVDAALDSANENGYNFHGWQPIEVAYDLVAYSEDHSSFDPNDLVPFVTTWLDAHPQQQPSDLD